MRVYYILSEGWEKAQWMQQNRRGPEFDSRAQIKIKAYLTSSVLIIRMTENNQFCKLCEGYEKDIAAGADGGHYKFRAPC